MKNLLLAGKGLITSFVLYSITVLLFNSCSKSSDDPEPEPPTGSNCRLDSITGVLTSDIGGFYQTSIFTYDNQNRCIGYYSDNNYKQVYTYDTNNKLIRCDIFSGAIQKEV